MKKTRREANPKARRARLGGLGAGGAGSMRSGYSGAKMAWVLAESQISGDEEQRVGDVGLGTRQTRKTSGGDQMQAGLADSLLI